MKLSIITINFNNAEGLKKTFESVFEQTNKNFEYIVIDGGSTDGSKEIIENTQSKIQHWISESDNGIYDGMNKGISAAKGEYILFINSGDTLNNKNIIEEILPQLYNDDIISGDLQIIENDGRIWVNKNPETMRFSTLFQYTLLHPSTFIRKDCFQRVGNYDTNLKIVADWKWFIVAIGKHHATYKKIPQTIATFYADGVSSDPNNRKKLMAEREATLKKEFPLFVDDYEERYYYHQNTRELSILSKSRWVKLGKKLGFLKKAVEFENYKKNLWE